MGRRGLVLIAKAGVLFSDRLAGPAKSRAGDRTRSGSKLRRRPPFRDWEPKERTKRARNRRFARTAQFATLKSQQVIARVRPRAWRGGWPNVKPPGRVASKRDRKAKARTKRARIGVRPQGLSGPQSQLEKATPRRSSRAWFTARYRAAAQAAPKREGRGETRTEGARIRRHCDSRASPPPIKENPARASAFSADTVLEVAPRPIRRSSKRDGPRGETSTK